MVVCHASCATCFGTEFYQCLTCLNSEQTLSSGLCTKQPTFIIQIICTFLLVIFLLPNLMRKRCVTLMRIFDAIQIVAYFKYINAYMTNRHNYLYMAMRAWSGWSQGWGLVQVTGDVGMPVWVVEETAVNKIIRVIVVWAGIITVMLIMGMVKSMSGDSQIDFTTYVAKNFPIAMTLGFYVNVQDMSLIMANALNSLITTSPFSSIGLIIQFCSAIAFALIFLTFIIWMFYRINFNFMTELQKTPRKIYPHVYMFLLALDYDFFPSYELTALPQKAKKINRYSNIRIMQIFKKAALSFLIVNSLYQTSQTQNGEVFQILGLIIFFDIIWYVSLPYDMKTQKTQFILGITADILVIAVLVMPLVMSSEIIEMALCLALFGLGIVSAILEYCLDIYNIIPVDLYETGLSIIIQDKKLLKEIQQRKRLQQEHERMMRQFQEQNRKLKEQLEANNKKPKDDTQMSLPNLNNSKDQENFDHEPKEQLDHSNQPYEGNEEKENTDMNSQDLVELYRIDENRRRKVYQFSKKTQFTYSNKVQY